MAYSKEVVDRFESVLANPAKHSVGRFDPNDKTVISGMVGAPACGDVMKLDLKMKGNVIEDVKFKTYGCGSAIASSTLFVEMLKGKTIEEAQVMKFKNYKEWNLLKDNCKRHIKINFSMDKMFDNYEKGYIS